MRSEQELADKAASAELRDRVKQSLGSQHFASFRNLEVNIVGDCVVLRGFVPSFHERQFAVALCRHVAGVHQVIDQLVVPESCILDGLPKLPRRPK